MALAFGFALTVLVGVCQLQCSSAFVPTKLTLLPSNRVRSCSQRAAIMSNAANENMNVNLNVERVAMSRRTLAPFLAVALSAPAIANIQSVGAEEAGDLVMQGELRLEEGVDKKFQKVGGTGTAEVTLRIVGRGIISKTKINVYAKDFPPAGKPVPGSSGGVEFSVFANDLNKTTEKGVSVTKRLWAEDDIFVRVDLLDSKGKKIALVIETQVFHVFDPGVAKRKKNLVRITLDDT